MTFWEPPSGRSSGDITAAKLRKRRRPVEVAIAECQDRIRELQGESALDRFAGSIRERWHELSIDDRRMVISTIVIAVWVDPSAKRGFNRFDPERLRMEGRLDVIEPLSSSSRRSRAKSRASRAKPAPRRRVASRT